MKCPFCQTDDDQVLDTRPNDDGTAIRRRRKCRNCKRRFTTYERVERVRVKVVKRDGTRVPFDRDKIRLGLERACWKRPVKDSQIEAIVLEVENHVDTNFDTEVDSQYLGELVMKLLRGVDQVAYVRFASVYRQFKDAQDFVRELGPMLTDPPEGP